ncbi:MAG: S-adenosyl-l-methionine hydroxide adenosyltransferase family protein [Actinomycetota bacterium]
MSGHRYDTISFLSDYGTRDEFVGIVKGVIADLAPHAKVIDLTHEIPPFDVRAGSLALARCISYVPSGIVLAVVDPGVGTARRGVALSVGGGRGVLIGPDNGLLSMGTALAGGADAAVVLNNPRFHLEAPGTTFAGRDIFAPVAAHLCNGVPFDELGEAIDPNLLLPGVVPLPRNEGDEVVAEVTWVDRYGNCQLNVGPDEVSSLGDRVSVVLTSPTGERTTRAAGIVNNFAEIGGGIGLVVDSFGMLAICIDRGSAADELSIAAGDAVRLSAFTETGGVTTNVHLRRGPAGE